MTVRLGAHITVEQQSRLLAYRLVNSSNQPLRIRRVSWMEDIKLQGVNGGQAVWGGAGWRVPREVVLAPGDEIVGTVGLSYELLFTRPDVYEVVLRYRAREWFHPSNQISLKPWPPVGIDDAVADSNTEYFALSAAEFDEQERHRQELRQRVQAEAGRRRESGGSIGAGDGTEK